MSRRTSRKVSVRHGSIKAPGFSAVEYKGSNPVFKGRISVDRGSGMVEFPDASQVQRILREENIDKSAADAAFGHMSGAKRRTSRAASKKIHKNGGATRVVAQRGGFISIITSDPKTGEVYPISFTEYTGKDERQRYTVIGARLDKPTEPTITIQPQHVEEMLVKVFGVPPKIVQASFAGILKSGKVTPRLSEAMEVYGSRSTKLGHFNASGRPVSGVIPGALVAFNQKTGGIIVTFETNPDKEGKVNPELPIRWGKGWLGGANPGGRGATFAQGYAKAQEYGIPEEAFVEAFGHLISRRKRAALWAGIRSGKKS